MESSIIAIAIAVGTGLTWLAYNHPKTYSDLSPWFQILIVLIFVGMALWDITTTITFTKLIPFFDNEKIKEAEEIADSQEVLSITYSVTMVIALVYINLIKKIYKLRDKR